MGKQIHGRNNLCTGWKRIQLASSTLCYTTHIIFPGHDEDLDAGRIIRFTKMLNGFHRFQQYYSVFFIRTVNF
jgi:hypothetical protein